METDSTVSGETMEDVLQECGFKQHHKRQPWHWKRDGDDLLHAAFACFVAMRDDRYLALRWGRKRYVNVRDPAHLRRIVAAEVACAAAWTTPRQPKPEDATP